MAVCSFIGHADVYDADIEYRLQRAVEDVVNKNETVDFCLYPHGDFFNYCLLAVLRAKNSNPQKVKICLVAGEAQYEKFMQQEPGCIPACMVDSITLYHMEKIETRDITAPYKKLLRFIVEKSSYVISCVYEGLHKYESHILHFAQRRRGLELISVANAETEQKIIEYESELNEKELMVLHKMNEGFSLQDAGAILGVGRERTRQILSKGCYKIRKKLEIRCSRGRKTLGLYNRSCGVFALGKENNGSMQSVERMIDFLVEKYFVRAVYIERSYVYSGFSMLLRKKRPWRNDYRLTAVTEKDAFAGNTQDDRDLLARYCPPCDAVLCIGVPSKDNSGASLCTIADIIGRSDFCIFDSATASHIEKMQQYITPERRTVFLDIGRTDVIKAD